MNHAWPVLPAQSRCASASTTSSMEARLLPSQPIGFSIMFMFDEDTNTTQPIVSSMLFTLNRAKLQLNMR